MVRIANQALPSPRSPQPHGCPRSARRRRASRIRSLSAHFYIPVTEDLARSQQFSRSLREDVGFHPFAQRITNLSENLIAICFVASVRVTIPHSTGSQPRSDDAMWFSGRPKVSSTALPKPSEDAVAFHYFPSLRRVTFAGKLRMADTIHAAGGIRF